MSDGAYRDDQEAALARAEALEHDNAELRDKVHALEAKLRVPLPAPAPRPLERSGDGAAGSRKRNLVAFIGLVAAFCIALPIYECRNTATADNQRKRFAAYARLSECFRASLEDAIEFPADLASSDVRPNEISLCDEAIAVGLADEVWRRALAERNAAVRALHDYYSHRDYQDDHLASAPAMWTRAGIAARANNAAAHAALPALTTVERAIRAAQGRRQDLRWWKLELAAQLQIAEDHALRGEPVSPVDIAGAPAEVQQLFHGLSSAPGSEVFRNDALEALAHE